jgi:hypothetical protein
MDLDELSLTIVVTHITYKNCLSPVNDTRSVFLVGTKFLLMIPPEASIL